MKPLVGVIMGSASDWATMTHTTETLESLGMRSWHALPLVAHGEATGVLSLATVGDRSFSERDLELAREFAGRAALALTNAYDFERERQARESAERASERVLRRFARRLSLQDSDALLRP